MALDGAGAIAAMNAMRTNVPGSCLNTVWQAYGSQPSTGPHAGQYPNAIDGWNYATDKHPGDMNPPAGVPVYFGVSPTRTDEDAGAGDVVISLGGGNVIATDANGRAGVIGVTTIAARASIIQRPYLGWTGDFLGYPVAYGQTMTQKRDDTMPTYNETQQAVFWPNGNGYYNSYQQGVFNALKYWIDNGEEQPGTEGTVQREIYAVLDAVTARDVQAEVSAVVAAVRASLPAGQGGDVDEAAIIAGVLAGLPKSYTVTPVPVA